MSFINWNSKKIINENTNNYMDDIDYDYIEEARGKKIADPLRAKLMGMEDIRDLKGTMTPRYFATKVMRYLQRNHPDTDLADISNEVIQDAIKIVSITSKPLMGTGKEITTREVGSAAKDLKRGDSGFETLFLNLDDDAQLSHDGDVGGNELYSIESNGLKYRVTLNDFVGTKVNLNDISKGDVVSVVIVKPREYEAVDKLADEIDLGKREKLVADFPEGESEPAAEDQAMFSTPSMVQSSPYLKRPAGTTNPTTASGKLPVKSKIELGLDKLKDAASLDKLKDASPLAGAAAGAALGYGLAKLGKDKDEEDAEFDAKKSDLDDDGKISEYERARGEAIAKAMSKSEEKDDKDEDEEFSELMKGLAARQTHAEEDERCPVTGKLRKKKSSDEEDNEEVALSPQQINQMMIQRGREEMQRHHQIERIQRYGY